MQTRRMWTLVAAAALITAACGDSKSSLLPTAPSSLSADSTSVAANTPQAHSGSMGNGPKPGNGNGNGTATDPAAGEKVEFEGFVDAVAGGSITVNDNVITVTSATVIRHGSLVLQLSELRQRDRVHVTANRSGSALEAVEIKLQNQGEGDAPAPDPDQVVSVTAVDDRADEVGPDPGTFRLTRTGTAAQLALPLPVNLTLMGTATSADYALSPAAASFGANQASVDVTVTPATDGLVESMESVVLQLTAGTGYLLGSPAAATVNIADAPPPDPNQVVSVVAVDNSANETGAAGTNTGTFRLSRTGTTAQLGQPLTVSFSLNGTATPGLDYVLPTSATFGPSQSTVDLTLTPAIDAAESAETAVLTLTAGATYDVGSAASATILITDDPLPQVSVTATRPSALEGSSNGRFVLTRTGSSTSRLQVTVRYGGSAKNGSGTWSPENDFDYSLPTTIEFEPGSLMLTLNVIAVADGISEPLETVEITVLPGDLYELGAAVATVTITSSN